MSRIISALFLAIAFLITFSSCRKNVFDNDPSMALEFSTDTLTFDTVFTTLGSTTLSFKVYNPHNNGVRTDVILAGGDASNFRLNVDGVSGIKHDDVEIFGDDSIYVFVEVTVDPNGLNTPLVLLDSVMFNTNGNMQKVILEAWGQDAFFFRDSVIGNQTWTNVKPYVIVRAMAVDSGATLKINPGTQIYMGGRAQLVVVGTGKINIAGTKDEPVVFQGIRLEDFYDDLPGQWAGIFILRGSTGNEINWAEIKNADYGIHAGFPIQRIESCADYPKYYTGTDLPQLTLKNTIIKNSFVSALATQLANVTVENCLFFNSGDYLVSLALGGNYILNHCTFANYGSPTINHQKASFFVSNVLYCNNSPIIAGLDVDVTNTIVYGSLDEEVGFSYEDGAAFDVLFDHCLLKTERDSDDTLQFVNVIKNLDPQFLDRAEDDYNIMSASPAVDAGKSTLVTTDLNNNTRSGNPDIGAYEFSE